MAFPALSATKVETAPTTSGTITTNAMTRAAGNLLWEEVWIENTTAVPSTPEGWILAWKEVKTNFQINQFFRIADNTTKDNFTSTWTGTPLRFGEMRKITGNSTNIAELIIGGRKTNNITTVTFSELETVSAENLILGIYNTNFEVTPSGATAGWTKQPGSLCPLYTKELAAIGLSGKLEFTIAAANWITGMIAVPPPPVVGETQDLGMLL